MFYNVLFFFFSFSAAIGFQIVLFSFIFVLCSQIFFRAALSETFVSLPSQIKHDSFQSVNGNTILNCKSDLLLFSHPLQY